MKVRGDFLGPPRSTGKTILIIKVSKGAKIRNRYNQVPHLNLSELLGPFRCITAVTVVWYPAYHKIPVSGNQPICLQTAETKTFSSHDHFSCI